MKNASAIVELRAASIKVLKQLLNQNKKRKRSPSIMYPYQYFLGAFFTRLRFLSKDNIFDAMGMADWTQNSPLREGKKMLISRLFIYSFRTCSIGIEFSSHFSQSKKAKGINSPDSIRPKIAPSGRNLGFQRSIIFFQETSPSEGSPRRWVPSRSEAQVLDMRAKFIRN